MDFTCQRTEEGSPISKISDTAMTVHDELNKPAAQEEYDPSQPLDSSDEEEEPCSLQFEKDVTHILPTDSEESLVITTSVVSKNAAVLPKESDIDLNSIPMPSDEYRRPAIQFQIPSRHRLMSISSLIKRQKGVVKKQDKIGGSGLCYNSEVSKAFPRSDSSGEPQSATVDELDDDRPKISLVQEIFGSDDEENPKDTDDQDLEGTTEVTDSSSQPSADFIEETDDTAVPNSVLSSQETEDSSKRWKTVAEPIEDASVVVSEEILSDSVPVPNNNPPADPVPTEENAGDELRISIKPSSELMEKCFNEESSPEVEPIEPIIIDDDEKGKENRHIVLECVSDEDADFEVTFVGIGKTNLNEIRAKQGRQDRRIMDKTLNPRKKSISPLNGFEEGEIVEQLGRKKKKAKKKKSKKRKRSKDSRVSSRLNSERSHADSVEKKSFSDNSDSKEVSWRKPKMTKSRNYRNGKRESEEKYAGDRSSRHEDGHKKGRSPGRLSGVIDKTKSRRQRSLSNSRFRSRSRSGSRDSISRWDSNRSRGVKRPNRGGSFRSRSSISNHSGGSHSRSRSLTKKKPKRRHSPSPAKKHRNGRSVSRSPARLSKSPRPHKRNKSNGTETNKRDKIKDKSDSPADTQSSKKSSKSKPEETLVDEVKKKEGKKKDKDKPSSDVEKEKKKKRKRREKSVSPVKAIVADGDSIVVSLSFQKAKEEVIKTPKVTNSTKNESSSEKHKSNSKTAEQSDDSERTGGTRRPSPRKGTITINLDASPRQDLRRSPDIIVLEEYDDSTKKSSENKTGQDHKLDGKSSYSVSSQRAEGLDFVSSSHDCAAEGIQNAFSTLPDPKIAASPAERAASASKSPYKFSEYFVSSTCDVGKTASPAVESFSPKNYTPSKTGDTSESSLSQKVSDNSPFRSSETPRPGNSAENGSEKLSTSSPESAHLGIGKVTGSLPSKPMIGNIPGLFPSGFSSSSGGMTTAPPIVIPAPPRIIPNTNPPNLLNPNVLVSVASALYAPLLAKHNAVGGQAGSNVLSSLQRHSQDGNALFSRNQNSHGQSLGLYNNRGNNGSGEQGRDGDSPFSPNSSDGDDLFEPPGDGMHQEGGTPNKKSGSDSLHHQSNSGNSSANPAFGKYQSERGGNEKRHIFDTLFGPPMKSTHPKHGKKKNSSHLKKSKPKSRGVKRTESDKNGEGEISARLTEDVPGSAVALKMKEKFLKKLNRQERVVEEVKLSLKPHYSKKHVTKDEYKDILRRAVPKICHNKSGEINPHKIKELVEAYVKKFRKTRKSEKDA